MLSTVATRSVFLSTKCWRIAFCTFIPTRQPATFHALWVDAKESCIIFCHVRFGDAMTLTQQQQQDQQQQQQDQQLQLLQPLLRQRPFQQQLQHQRQQLKK